MLMQITYINNPNLLFLFIDALEQLDKSNVSKSLTDTYFSNNRCVSSMNISIIQIVCSFLKLNFNVERTTPFNLFLYSLFPISHADICAQALYDLFTIHLIANFYIKQFNDIYESYLFDISRGELFTCISMNELIKTYHKQFISDEGARLYKIHGIPYKSIVAEFTQIQFYNFIFFILKETNLYSDDFLSLMYSVLDSAILSFTVLEDSEDIRDDQLPQMITFNIQNQYT